MSAMFRVGDRVVYIKDGAVGVIISIQEDRYHIVWEDNFSSWEKAELLRKIGDSPAAFGP